MPTHQLDLRAARLDFVVHPGNTASVVFTFPAVLTGRTFTAAAGMPGSPAGTPTVTPTVTAPQAGVTVTVSLTEAQTTTLGTASAAWWKLTETTGGGTQDLVAGKIIPEAHGTGRVSSTTTVVVGTNSVPVTVIGTDVAALTDYVDDAVAALAATIEAGDVDSVNGRTGTVTGLAEADASNVSGSAAGWRTALGLGTAAQQATGAFDAAGSAAAAQAAAVQRANHTGTQLAATVSDFSAAALAATSGAYVARVADATGVRATDEAAFQAAITALPATGGLVVLGRGTYIGRFFIDKANVTVEGQGMGASTLKVPNAIDAGAQALTIVADKVTVRDLTVDGNKAGQTFAGDITRESDGVAIYANDCLIERVHSKNAAGHGIIVWDEATSTHNGSPNATAAAAGRRGNQIIGNVVEDNGVATDLRSAIDIAVTNANVDNVVARNLVIMGDNTASGITMHGGSRTVIDGNIIICPAKERAMMIHTGSYGCRVVNNLIVKKAATNGVQYGVSISGTISDTLFEGNHLESDRNDAAFALMADTCTAVLFANNRAKFSAAATGTVSFLRLSSTITTLGVRLRSNHTLNADKPVHDVDGQVATEAAVSVLDQWEADAVVAATEAALRAWNPLPIRKTADETVNNSVTLQNDDALVFAIGADEVWVAKFVLFVVAATGAPDLLAAITVPAGATLMTAGYGPRAADALVNSPGIVTVSGTSLGYGVTGTGGSMIVIEVYVANGATAGNVQLQWAQSTITAVDTTVKAGSYVTRQRVA